MKAAAFDYERPPTLERAIELLRAANGDAKVLAGGQSLGPMLNLRLATPRLVVDVTRIPELRRTADERDAVVIGACVTHADIEDGRVPDATRGVMPGVARAIAYRAVRNRGTVGGSLAHADPSADWPTALAALGAEAMIAGPAGRRHVPVAEFLSGAFESTLAADEILEAVRVPKLSARARWGFHKVCRKPGKFAEAMSAVLWDPDRGVRRAVIGATDSRPITIGDARGSVDRSRGGGADALSEHAVAAMLDGAGLGGDSYSRRIHLVSFRRALAQIQST
ncbi:MAG: FAD binding domain-containing protein [Burkholderiales bacterium]|nr:FAD binding domain-containing protein [Burkholderiales bacterium]MCC7113534.1 FAD binding domain-containing protein [Burkholderiales bacterium]